jgi:hypothetical protein
LLGSSDEALQLNALALRDRSADVDLYSNAAAPAAWIQGGSHNRLGQSPYSPWLRD